MTMKEKWKPAKGFEDYYEVSTFGSVRRKGCEHALKCFVSNGRRIVDLWCNGQRKMYRVHRLVAETFIPNPENKPEVNHINGDPMNNCVWNLEWATRSENQLHAYAHGLASCTKAKRRKLSDAQRKTPVRRSDGKIFKSVTEAAKAIGCNSSSVSSVVNGKRKHVKGYRFTRVGDE